MVDIDCCQGIVVAVVDHLVLLVVDRIGADLHMDLEDIHLLEGADLGRPCLAS